MTLARHVGAAIVAAVVIWVLSVSLSSFRDYQIAEIAVYVVAIAGLTVLIGLSGQISLGNGAFMAIGAYATALLLLHLDWPLWARVPGQRGDRGGGRRWRSARPPPGCAGPTWPGATLMLAVALPSLADPVPRRVRRRPGADRHRHRPRRARRRPSRPPAGWPGSDARHRADRPGPAGQPRPQPGRPVAGGPSGTTRSAAALAGLNVARLRILAFVVSAACAGPGRRHARRLLLPGLAGRVHRDPVHRAAHRRGDRRPGQPGRRAVGQPRHRPGADLRHGRGHQPRPVQPVAANIPIAAYGVVLIAVMLLFPDGIQGGLRRFFGLNRTRRHRPAHPLQLLAPASARQRTPGGRHHMNRSHRVRIPAIVAAAAAVAMVAAGCGGSSAARRSSGPPARRHRVRAGHHRDSILIGSHQPLTGPAAPGYSEIAPGRQRLLPVRQRARRHLRPQDQVHLPR